MSNSGIMTKEIVLKLGADWRPIGKSTVEKAFVDLVSGAVRAVDIRYAVNGDGQPDFKSTEWVQDMNWDDWIKTPILPWHETIHTPKMEVRVPTVVVAFNCKHMPKKRFKNIPSNKAVYFRDRGRCQYTGKKLTSDEASVDHVVPVSKGGKNIWTNVVLTSKELNRQKSNKLNSEVGLKPLKPPVKPQDVDMCLTINEARHRDWNLFLVVKE
jgi:hypothetical protein